MSTNNAETTETTQPAEQATETETEVSSDEDEDEDEDEKSEKKKDKKKDKDEKKDKKKKEKDEKKDKQKIAYEATMPRAEAVAYFEALVGGLRSGHLEFRQDGRVLVLAPPDQLEIEVEAQQKGNKGKITFEIEWSSENRPLAIINEPPATSAEPLSPDALPSEPAASEPDDD